ncbi:hypothetical protein FHS22_004719 [Planomonospora venezuelensis]|uniref:Uncharacterized protein n=1 Tax=Planomonospora venezuelensis TaxID=1999 RepID=A0A841D7I5_PLAVE|nr:hypothetical protein [Planomonospora venezuelensis]
MNENPDAFGCHTDLDPVFCPVDAAWALPTPHGA